MSYILSLSLSSPLARLTVVQNYLVFKIPALGPVLGPIVCVFFLFRSLLCDKAHSYEIKCLLVNILSPCSSSTLTPSQATLLDGTENALHSLLGGKGDGSNPEPLDELNRIVRSSISRVEVADASRSSLASTSAWAAWAFHRSVSPWLEEGE